MGIKARERLHEAAARLFGLLIHQKIEKTVHLGVGGSGRIGGWNHGLGKSLQRRALMSFEKLRRPIGCPQRRVRGQGAAADGVGRPAGGVSVRGGSSISHRGDHHGKRRRRSGSLG